VIALAIAVVGGGPLAHDPRIPGLSNRSAPDAARTQEVALAPVTPVPSDGDPAANLAAVQASARKHTEAVIKAAPSRFEGPAPRAVPPPAAIADGSVSSQGNRQGGTWAVVIGVNDYPGSGDDLSYAVNDANDAVQALGMLGVSADHMLVLRDGQVTRNTLLDSVSWLAAHAAPEAVAGFFYAGHVRKTAGGNEEIVTSDGSSVTDSQLASALNKVVANRSWVAIAACYGGGFTEVLRPGRVLSAAAGANSLAYENSSIGRSYMVYYMIRQAIINGRASATVQSAFNYAVDRISQEHPGREPIQVDNGDGALDLRPPGSNAAPPRSEPPPSNPSPTPPAEEPPAGDRPPSGGQTCTGSGLFRICKN
jgi:hypothetical protein